MEYDKRIFNILNEAYGDEEYPEDPPNIDKITGRYPMDDSDLKSDAEAEELIKNYMANGSQGDLDLSNHAIREFPVGFDYVGGNLNLSNCRVLEYIPDNFEVRGDLDITNCQYINRLPTGLIVYGNLDAHKSGLTHVENGVTIRGYSMVDATPISDSWESIKAKRPGIA